MVQSVRNAEKSMGKVDYNLIESKIKSRVFSRSLYVAEDIKKGETINERIVQFLRPGYGLPPKYIKGILGMKANTSLPVGTPFAFKYLDTK